MADPCDRKGGGKPICQSLKALGGPTLVSAAGLGVNDDSIRGFAPEGGEIRRRWRAPQARKSRVLEQFAHKKPVVTGRGDGWVEGSAMSEQRAKRELRIEWSHFEGSAGKVSEQVGHVALVIGNETCLGTDRTNQAGMAPQSGRVFPGRIEIGRGKGKKPDLGECDFEQWSGERAGGQGHLPLRMPLEQSLEGREKHHVVPELVDFENEAAHGHPGGQGRCNANK